MSYQALILKLISALTGFRDQELQIINILIPS